MASERDGSTPVEQVARLYEQAETQAAQAGERLVGSRGFAGLLGQMAENAAAVNRLSTDALDLILRNLRLAGRRDVVRLARQLARTEDKLERVLQEVEELRDELTARGDAPAGAGARAGAGAGAAAAAGGNTGSRPARRTGRSTGSRGAASNGTSGSSRTSANPGSRRRNAS